MICETMDKELTCRAVAKALRINRKTALRWLIDRTIPGAYQKRPDGYWYIRESALREYLEAIRHPVDDLDRFLESL